MSLFDTDLVQKALPGPYAAKAWMETQIKQCVNDIKKRNGSLDVITSTEFKFALIEHWLDLDTGKYNDKLKENGVYSTSTRVTKNDKSFFIYIELKDQPGVDPVEVINKRIYY